MVAFRGTATAIHRAGLTDFAANLAVSAAQAGGGAVALVTRYVDWRPATDARGSARAAAFGRGLAIAVLPIVAFTALFASADVFFRDLLRNIAVIFPDEAVSHVLLTVLFAWLAASYLWGALLAEREPVPEVPRPPLRFEFIETGVVFGLINALFLVFVAVQLRYLFGGSDRVESSSTLTYAEYARRGFFELVVVGALVVVFILLTHWLLARGRPALHRFYAALAGLLVLLVFVVMASAVERMRLYQETFGLTELRLYTTAFMMWIGVVLVWLVLTVLRGQRDRFAFGAVTAGIGVVVVLNVLNPDALIVQRNAAMTGGDGERPFDSDYVLALSADSVPALIDNFDEIPPDDRCLVARELQRRHVEEHDDWRSWSWSRYRARDAVSSSVQVANACGPRG
jgi:hypothetical protein